MRHKISGFATAIVMTMAIGGLTAPPAFATDYFVKYLNTVSSPAYLCDPQAPSGPRHGSVVFRRTSTSMFATVYVRGAASNSSVTATMIGHTLACEQRSDSATTDSHGNATLHVGPEARKGKGRFFVHVTVGSQGYETVDVPAFGF